MKKKKTRLKNLVLIIIYSVFNTILGTVDFSWTIQYFLFCIEPCHCPLSPF